MSKQHCLGVAKLAGAAAALLGLLSACGGQSPADGRDPGGVGGHGEGGAGGAAVSFDAAAEATRMLTGRFDSADQAALQPSYFPVQLFVCPLSAPELGERVLYVEQAVMSDLQAPYRQRLYVVDAVVGQSLQAVSRVFELNDPAAFVGLCEQSSAVTVGSSETVERQGCWVQLSWQDDHFAGATPGSECLSDFQGASYATSEVELHADRISSWDRGWSQDGQQVWGATMGPYEFVRRTPLTPSTPSQ